MDEGIVHIAGLDLAVDGVLRQRCAWCGATLIDQDLRLIAFQADDPDKRYPTWEVGALVCKDGGLGYIIEYTEGEKLPPNCCAAIDPTVTA